MKTLMNFLGSLGALVLLGGLLACQRATPPAETPTAQMPQPRDVPASEQQELLRLIAQRGFVKDIPRVEFRAAGAYRFVGAQEFLYIDRTDTGSVAFEMASYGTGKQELQEKDVNKDVLLPQLEEGLLRTGLKAEGMQFDGFQDEYSGAAEPRKLSRDFDPQRASSLVARTASFVRMIEGVPVFGSELLIGLNPDGRIGRLRLHWPTIERRVLEESRKLREAVTQREWRTPEAVQGRDIEILEVKAGVGHSSFADPGFRSAAVVRVLYRKRSVEKEYPLVSTGYRYFDAAGNEVRFTAFPSLPTTLLERKPADGKKQ